MIVGDRVICTKKYDEVLYYGMTGRIKFIDEDGSELPYAVEWDNFCYGHDCDGNCIGSSGYWVSKSIIKKHCPDGNPF